MTCARGKIGQDGRGSHSLVAFMALDKRYKIKVADWDIVGKYCVWPSKMDYINGIVFHRFPMADL